MKEDILNFSPTIMFRRTPCTCRVTLRIYGRVTRLEIMSSLVSPFMFKNYKTIIVYNIIFLHPHPISLIVIAWYSIDFSSKQQYFLFLNFWKKITPFRLKEMDVNMIFFTQDPLGVEFKLYGEEPKVRVQLRGLDNCSGYITLL